MSFPFKSELAWLHLKQNIKDIKNKIINRYY